MLRLILPNVLLLDITLLLAYEKDKSSFGYGRSRCNIAPNSIILGQFLNTRHRERESLEIWPSFVLQIPWINVAAFYWC